MQTAVSSQPLCMLGLSPCPNDTFIFHALLQGLVPCCASLVPHLSDVEDLNSRVVRGEPEFSKLSVGVVADVMDRYALLSSGAALGFGCGPLVVAKKDLTVEEQRSGVVAIPGKMTTANLLLTLTDRFHGERREMVFSEIIPAVARGDVALGVIIHEGRFTYAQQGLVKILDLGAWWEETYNLPLPLGAIAVRRDVLRPTALDVQDAIAASLRYAWAHPEASWDFVAANAQELSRDVIAAHIRTFVTKYSLDLGAEGRRAVAHLVSCAAKLCGKTLPQDGLFLV